MTIREITSILIVLLMLTGTILVLRQMSLSRKISAADFAVRLREELSQFKHIFKEFFPEGKWAPGRDVSLSNEEEVEIKEYLAFYESIYTLQKRNLVTSFLDIEDLDELFGYRFFITMHNPITKNIIADNPEAWDNLKALYWDWLDHCTASGKRVVQKEHQWIRV